MVQIRGSSLILVIDWRCSHLLGTMAYKNEVVFDKYQSITFLQVFIHMKALVTSMGVVMARSEMKLTRNIFFNFVKC